MGVGTGDASLHAAGYQSLVGNDDQSWGWDIGRLKVKYLNYDNIRTEIDSCYGFIFNYFSWSSESVIIAGFSSEYCSAARQLLPWFGDASPSVDSS